MILSGKRYFKSWVILALRDALERSWRATKTHVLYNKVAMMVRGVITGQMT